MQFYTQSNFQRRNIADALVVPLFEGHFECEGLYEAYQGPIIAGDFTGKAGQVVAVWANHPEEKRIFLVGLGDREKVSFEAIRRGFGELARQCIKYKCKSLNIAVPEVDSLPVEGVVKALVEGLFLAGYVPDIYKKERETLLDVVTLIGPDHHKIQHAQERTQKVMDALWRTRDLINRNADEITPDYLARVAIEISQEFTCVKAEVKDKSWLEKEGMGLILAVSRAASSDPKCILLSYTGHPASSDRTILVGKGITYDTGGLKLKSVEGMLAMRSDMSGAAVCLGVIQALAAAHVPVNVTAVIPACENSIDKESYKLGDVYTSRSGRTVEITNTDAEGRLILADALSYAADTLNPSRIIDIGTLTGGMEIALGNECMGLFSNSDPLASELFQAGQRTYERMWRMPLYEEYKKELQSDVADCKNAATPRAGSIICALFLEQFVQGIPWAHLDIAPVAFAKEARSYWPKYATGIGVRLLVDYLEQLGEKNDT